MFNDSLIFHQEPSAGQKFYLSNILDDDYEQKLHNQWHSFPHQLYVRFSDNKHMLRCLHGEHCKSYIL